MRGITVLAGCAGLGAVVVLNGIAQGQYMTAGPVFPGVREPVTSPASEEPYAYDDGSSENILGLIKGGTICWLHYFETEEMSDTVSTILVAFGSPKWPGLTPPEGSRAWVAVWDDPTNDGDPSDAFLVTLKETTIENVDTDIFNRVELSSQVTVRGGFFIGAWAHHDARQYIAPMDETTPYVPGRAWVVGDSTDNFDPNDLMNNDVPPKEMGDDGRPAYFLLRAESGSGFELTLLGPCPGEVQLTVTGATPGGGVAFLYGFNSGETELPGPLCAGTIIDIAAPRLAAYITADTTGRASTILEVTEWGCGRTYTQALDAVTCATTEVVIH